jgi:hypothetical protein
MSVCGPSRTSRLVCFCAAIGGQPDIKRSGLHCARSSYPPLPVAACRCWTSRAILSPWALSHANPSTAQQSARRRSGQRRRASRPTGETWNRRMLGFKDPAQPSPTRSTRVRLSRSPVPRLRYPPDRRARHCPPPEGNADSLTGALHALQGLLAGSRLCLQTEPLDRVAREQDFIKYWLAAYRADGEIND